MTSLATAPVRTIWLPDICMRAAILLGAALAIAPTAVLAEIQVRGSPEAVRVEARDTPVEDILAALSRAFGMHYTASDHLDKRVSGTYVGPLPRVLTRILNGYNFILKTDDGSLAVTVVGTPNAAAAAVPATSGAKVVRQPAAAAPPEQPPSVGEDRARPPTASGSTAVPSPAVEIAEGPAVPTPARPTSGSVPAPEPELRESAVPAPEPPAPGSKATPAPEPGKSSEAPSPVAGPTPPSGPRRAQ